MELSAQEKLKLLPSDWKRWIVDVSHKLPQDSRNQFITDAVDEFVALGTKVLLDHKLTITYAAIGTVLGCILDCVATITIPFPACFGGPVIFNPTAGKAWLFLGIVGFVYGFGQDLYYRLKRSENEYRLKKIMREELKVQKQQFADTIQSILCDCVRRNLPIESTH